MKEARIVNKLMAIDTKTGTLPHIAMYKIINTVSICYDRISSGISDNIELLVYMGCRLTIIVLIFYRIKTDVQESVLPVVPV